LSKIASTELLKQSIVDPTQKIKEQLREELYKEIESNFK